MVAHKGLRINTKKNIQSEHKPMEQMPYRDQMRAPSFLNNLFKRTMGQVRAGWFYSQTLTRTFLVTVWQSQSWRLTSPQASSGTTRHSVIGAHTATTDKQSNNILQEINYIQRQPDRQYNCRHSNFSGVSMMFNPVVLKLDGNSEIGVYVRSNLCYLICLRHLIISRAVTNLMEVKWYRETYCSLNSATQCFIPEIEEKRDNATVPGGHLGPLAPPLHQHKQKSFFLTAMLFL